MPLTNVIEIHVVLLFTLHNSKNIAYHITDELIFYSDKLTVMGNSKNLRVFNFMILLKSRKSRKFNAREIYMFYNSITVVIVFLLALLSVLFLMSVLVLSS